MNTLDLEPLDIPDTCTGFKPDTCAPCENYEQCREIDEAFASLPGELISPD